MSSFVIHSLQKFMNLSQELGGDMWVFKDKAVIFMNDHLIGGPEDLMVWAEDRFNYKNFRPLPLYETLAEACYKKYLNSTNVSSVPYSWWPGAR